MICIKCLKDKEEEEFYKNKGTKSGFDSICKLCVKIRCESRYLSKKQEILIYAEEYRSRPEVKEKKRKSDKNWKENNYEVWLKNQLKWRKENPNYNKEYRKKNLDYFRNYDNKKYKNNLNFRILKVIRALIFSYLKSNKSNSSIKYLGCSIPKYKLYLENQFLPEMSWSNHGKVWEIDHIQPLSSFNLTREEEQFEAFNWLNTQPLFKTTEIAESFGYKNYIGNREKSNK